MDESHGDSPLDSLQDRRQRLEIAHSWRRIKHSLIYPQGSQETRRCKKKVKYLVQEVSAMAGQSSTVIHYSWDVPVERGMGRTQPG